MHLAAFIFSLLSHYLSTCYSII